MKNECRKIQALYPKFESANNDDEDVGNLRKELFIISGNFRPPWVDIGA